MPSSPESRGAADAVVEIDVERLYEGQAKLEDLARYEEHALAQVLGGPTVVLTGRGPVWLYLRLAHALHGKARTLIYRSPVTGDVVVFNHDPF